MGPFLHGAIPKLPDLPVWCWSPWIVTHLFKRLISYIRACEGWMSGQFIFVSLLPSTGSGTRKNSGDGGECMFMNFTAVMNIWVHVPTADFQVLWLLLCICHLSPVPLRPDTAHSCAVPLGPGSADGRLQWKSMCILSCPAAGVTLVSVPVLGLSILMRSVSYGSDLIRPGTAPWFDAFV